LSDSLSEARELLLPFAHGIEVELQVIHKDGSWIRGEEILSIFNSLISNAKGLLDKRIWEAEVESVKRKYRHSTQTEEGERGSRIIAMYVNPSGEVQEYTLLGHDPNVTSLTWILEIATPPCTTLEELAWWVQTLIAISFESLPRDSRAILVSTGLNPAQEYLKNLSFGEHHHILSPEVDDEVRIQIYNMIRNFTPHLIALSVNSPFENKRPTGEIYIDDSGRTRAPKCKRSIRLLKNTTQMGPTNEFEFIPYISNTNRETFAKHVNRSPARMVDIYPFTDYSTIEVRIFDTQLSVPRRIGVAILLQALALKAQKILDQGLIIQDVGASSLAANRESAIAAGLWGPFHASDIDQDTDFLKIYNHSIDDTGQVNESKRTRFLGDAVISMLYLIREELEGLNVIDNPFLQPLLLSIFGSETVERKTTGADYQLDVYAKSDQNMVVLLKHLVELTRECSTNWLYDPLEGIPDLPAWLCWWKGIEPEIITRDERVFAGHEAEFEILLRNNSIRKIPASVITYSVEDLERNIIKHDTITVSELEQKDTFLRRIGFKTRPGISAYNIIIVVKIRGREIHLSSTINTYWMKAGIRPGTTTQFADGKAPVLFSGEIETNYPEPTTVDCEISVIAPRRESIIASVEQSIKIEGGEVTLLKNVDLPSLIIPTEGLEGVERCVLQIKLQDIDGILITETTSRPFYIGFVHKGPQLLLDLDSRALYQSGDVVTGEISFKGSAHELPSNGTMELRFKTKPGVYYEIASIAVSDLLVEPVRFQWRIPSFAGSNDVSGAIEASINKEEEIFLSAVSTEIVIEPLDVRLSIDSLNAPKQSHLNGKISGWLRIRRNTEQGDPAILKMILGFPNGETYQMLTQTVKQNRNLSLAFGPFIIPEPKEIENPNWVTLEAQILYAGALQDSRTVTIELGEEPHTSPIEIKLPGVPNFMEPGEIIEIVSSVSNESQKKQTCNIIIVLESVIGISTIIGRSIELKEKETKLIPISIQIPLGAEMSTAYLKVIIEGEDFTTEVRERIKVKAIEEPLLKVEFSIRDESGKEVPGLISRLTPVELNVELEVLTENIQSLELQLKVMSRRNIVEKFNLPVLESDNLRYEAHVLWHTPPVEMVTGYYLEIVALQGGKSLPARAIRQTPKQLTVY
jgi:gamma-glutamyl:cysteine ligase YbdK (ATP-grasp superfamily)